MAEEKTKREYLAAALIHLQQARECLNRAGSYRAAASTTRAMDSTRSAQRNARRIERRPPALSA